jgi:DNA recombination protein RmuC
MIVRLPNGRAIAVDAKTNIEAYLDAVDAPPEDAEAHIDRFARHVAEQAEALGKKDYWAAIDGAIDLVVMFIPGDQFVDAALSRRPDLIDQAAQRGIIIASPSTLIGLLRAVAIGWREKRLTDSAQELFKLGRELHERSARVLDLVGDVGSAIGSATSAFTKLVGSIDARLMPTLRKFEDAGASSEKTLAESKPIDATPRLLPQP